MITLCIILGGMVIALLATLYVREKVHRDQLDVIAQEFDDRANKIMFAQDIMTGVEDLKEMLETQRLNGYEDGFAAALRQVGMTNVTKAQPGALQQALAQQALHQQWLNQALGAQAQSRNIWIER